MWFFTLEMLFELLSIFVHFILIIRKGSDEEEDREDGVLEGLGMKGRSLE